MNVRLFFSLGSLALAACGVGYELIRPRRTWNDLGLGPHEPPKKTLTPGESQVRLRSVGHWCDAPIEDSAANRKCQEGHQYLRSLLEKRRDPGAVWFGSDPLQRMECRLLPPYRVEKLYSSGQPESSGNLGRPICDGPQTPLPELQCREGGQLGRKSSSQTSFQNPYTAVPFNRYVMVCNRRVVWSGEADFHKAGYPVVNDLMRAAGLSRDRMRTSSPRAGSPELEDAIQVPDLVDHLCVYLELEHCPESVTSCLGSSQRLARLFCQNLANRE